MLRAVKQIRAALALINPEEVRRLAARPVTIGLVASSGRGYAEMEGFLSPGRTNGAGLFRASDPNVPAAVDFVLYEPGMPCPRGAYHFRPGDPASTLRDVLDGEEELALPLARQFPVFRKPVVDEIVHDVSRENALFAVATALPNIVPSLIELPWAFGEFASDTAFITVNQMRMAFLIAGACGGTVGLSEQKGEGLSILAGAFGWRALARELAGKIPLGGGLIPKGAIAYAGTYLLGKGLAHFHNANTPFNAAERQRVYHEGLERGQAVVESSAPHGE